MNGNHHTQTIAQEWADDNMETYLGRCQIDTPPDMVALTWAKALEKRASFDIVIDLGAGDGRFAHGGRYGRYVGYEVDAARINRQALPENATVLHECALGETVSVASLCIGNPPFVRNQDLPAGWREKIGTRFKEKLGIQISGLANAWLYFVVQALASTADDGVCALVIPFEWTSRNSAKALRDHIEQAGWSVDVYRLSDRVFDTVLTTSSITVIDKSKRDGSWRYFELGNDGTERAITSPTGSDKQMIAYGRKRAKSGQSRIRRGVSPGTQKVFVLTEAERARNGLKRHVDVVPCVTSLRVLPTGISSLTDEVFEKYYRAAGRKCWLLVPDASSTSSDWSAYIDSVDPAFYDTATCRERDVWWKFNMPDIPDALIATCFKGAAPKCVENAARARAVGGVAGLHGYTKPQAKRFVEWMGHQDIRPRIVAHANGLFKTEIGQLNNLYAEMLEL